MGVSALVACGDGSHTNPPPITIGSTYPTSYVIVYRVVRNGVNQWEVLSVQRPSQASDLVYATDGAPRNGDHPVSGVISSPTTLYSVDAQTVRAVTDRQPGPPSGDEFLGGEIAELTKRGLATALGTSRTIAGDRCEDYRFSGPPSGPIAVVHPGNADHDDLCLDASGLVIAEAWAYHGQQVLQRTAVAMNSAATAPSATAAASPGPFAATVVPDAQPRSFIASPPAPAGFESAGPATDFRLPDRSVAGQTAAASIVWTFTHAARVITVEAGRQSSGALPWVAGDTATTSVTLRGLGAASTAVRSDGFEIRVDMGNGDWVRVRGTVPLDELISFAQLLTRA